MMCKILFIKIIFFLQKIFSTQVPVQNIQNKLIQQVIVGGKREGSGPVVNKFIGCVKVQYIYI